MPSLRKKQIHSVRFLLQYSVNHLIIDFYAPSIKLPIEVYGSSHIGKEEYYLARQKYIEALGVTAIRFTDEQVLGNTNKVLDKIKEIVKARLKELKQKSSN